jgi:glucose/arabinose dehydrogenase
MPPLLGLLTLAALLTSATPAVAQLVRRTNTSIKLPSTTPLPSGYTTTNALGSLSFNSPIFTATIPGDTTRLFVIERGGTVQLVTNLTGTPTKSLFLNLANVTGVSGLTTSGENGLLSLAFHPNFATNREFFIFYSFNSGGLRQRIARMRVQTTNRNLADPSFIQPLITQSDEAGNHNGGTLAFGPDGYLYVSLGDEGGADDNYNNGRFINKDFFSAILRLDVDKRSLSLTPNAHPAVHAGTYTIPPDNPFIGRTSWHNQPISPTSIRTEFYAAGLRNPFRFSFDAPTGRLFCADVGQGSFEEIHLIQKGDDCGWSWREGRSPFTDGPSPTTPPTTGFTPASPIFDYGRSGTVNGSSITGGAVYRGRLMPELIGQYLYADYVSGQIVALRPGTPTWQPTVLTTDASIVSFGHHPATTELIFCDLSSGQVKRLAHTGLSTTLPATLSATGAFTDLTTLTPATGVIPYDVNTPFWSDHATKSRFFAVRSSTAKFGFQTDANWTLPTGTVWIKHFDIETTRGNPATRRRLETRFLIKTATASYGLTYQWRDDQTDADLVPTEGLDFPIPGSSPAQTWRFPSRGECLSCHTPQGGHALSFNTAQLNKLSPTTGHGNQLLALAQAGYLNTKSLLPPGTLPALVALDNPQHSLTDRARSYLSANCAPCHQLGTGLPSTWDARHTLPLEDTGLLNAIPANPGTDPDNRLLLPGDTTHSVLLHRVAGTNGFSRMPPLGSNETDTAAVALLTSWIQANLASSITITTQPEDVQVSATGTTTFTVAATGTGPLTYQWQKDRIDLPNETTDTLTLANISPADIAGYSVIVTDANGSRTSRGARLQIVIKRPTITSPPPPTDATVSAAFTWPLTADEPSTTFTLRGLPPGLRYDSRTRTITGLPTTPGTYTLTITPRTTAGTGTPQTHTLTIAPLPLDSGAGATYTALIDRSPTLNQSLGGRLLLTVTPTGSASGTLTLGTRTHSLRGRVTVRPAIDVTYTTTLPRPGTTPLTLTLALPPNNTTVTGTLTDGTTTLPLTGHTYLPAASLTPAARSTIAKSAFQTHLTVPTADLGNLAKPQGTSYLRITGLSGTQFQAAGRLADNTALSFSINARDPRFTTFLRLDNNNGSALGHLTQGLSSLTIFPVPFLPGTIDWQKIRPASRTDRSYTPAGFALILDTQITHDTPPAPTFNRLGNPDTPDNTRIQFDHGGLTTPQIALLNQTLRLSPTGRVTLNPTAAATALKLTVNHRTGEFTGTFQLTDGTTKRTATYRGLISPTTGHPIGRGYFTLPGSTTTTTPILSGPLNLLPAP